MDARQRRQFRKKRLAQIRAAIVELEASVPPDKVSSEGKVIVDDLKNLLNSFDIGIFEVADLNELYNAFRHNNIRVLVTAKDIIYRYRKFDKARRQKTIKDLLL
jgi:hypothetical protein